MSVRKSISSAYFSMTAVVLVTSILAMGFLQMYLSMEYFKTDKENTLDDIVTLAAARASMEQGPLESWQESATGQQLQSTISLIGQSSGNDSKYDLHLPLGLSGYFDLDEGLAAAAAAGKPVFVDITGHGCVNCREMESRVWSDPEVLEILSNDYIIVALYTDDKTKLDKEDWVTTENGDVLKEMGRANSYIVRTRFGVNAQPNYVLLSPEGKLLAPVRGYDLSVPGFVAFLQKGLAGYFQEAGL